MTLRCLLGLHRKRWSEGPCPHSAPQGVPTKYYHIAECRDCGKLLTGRKRARASRRIEVPRRGGQASEHIANDVYRIHLRGVRI